MALYGVCYQFMPTPSSLSLFTKNLLYFKFLFHLFLLFNAFCNRMFLIIVHVAHVFQMYYFPTFIHVGLLAAVAGLVILGGVLKIYILAYALLGDIFFEIGMM